MVYMPIRSWFGIFFACAISSATMTTKWPESANSCEDLGPISNGKRDTPTGYYSIGSIVHYRCQNGYIMHGSSKQICVFDGRWEPPEKPTCSPVSNTCQWPLYVMHGTTFDISKEKRIGDTAVIRCDSGFAITGNSRVTVQCGDRGYWIPMNGETFDAQKPECIESICESAPSIAHGYSIAQDPFGRALEKMHQGTKVHYWCNGGYSFVDDDSTALVCQNGHWVGNTPTCVLSNSCSKPEDIMHGSWHTLTEERGYIYKRGTRVRYQCNSGYKVLGASVIECLDSGLWSHMPPRCIVNSDPNIYCQDPEPIVRGQCQCVGHDLNYCRPFIPPVQIECHCNPGYDGAGYTKLTCMENGYWDHEVPKCVKVLSNSCTKPQDIIHGSWQTMTEERGYVYKRGTRVRYQCNKGYKVLGASVIECHDSGLWSHIPPRCIVNSDPDIYCQDPESIVRGQCQCIGHDLNYCRPFIPPVQIECHCNPGYNVIDGYAKITCMENGHWDHEVPKCVKAVTDGPHETSSQVSMLAVVVATACSVLGLLLVIMVIVVFRRRKSPRPRLCRPAQAPPPYTRVHNDSVDEHDRVALIAYAEGSRIILPPYEEAIRRPRNVSIGGHQSQRSVDGVTPMDYRPLPALPAVMRVSTSSQPNTDINRNSTMTNSTINRDAMSEVFGSIDTVNVSVSDASTSVTIETYDSGASNPSVTSRRATCGSLNSSNGSLVTEDAPLLERSTHNAGVTATEVVQEQEDKET